MDILTSNITEEELSEQQHVIAEYLESYKEEQIRTLDTNFYQQHNGIFAVDRDRDFIGNIVDQVSEEVYDFLHGKTYKEILEIENISQAISRKKLDENHQEEYSQRKYSLLYGKSLKEVLEGS